MRNRLYFAMEKCNVSARELERRTGISHVHIGKIARGECDPTVPIAYKLCRALGEDIKYVFPEW